MRGAEDPAEQRPAEEAFVLDWKVTEEGPYAWAVNRTLNDRVVYRIMFNSYWGALKAMLDYIEADERRVEAAKDVLKGTRS